MIDQVAQAPRVENPRFTIRKDRIRHGQPHFWIMEWGGDAIGWVAGRKNGTWGSGCWGSFEGNFSTQGEAIEAVLRFNETAGFCEKSLLWDGPFVPQAIYPEHIEEEGEDDDDR